MDLNFEGKLTNLLKDITDWLKFAEAKNLALITFNSAWLAYYLKNMIDNDLYQYKFLYIIGSLFCIVSILLCFIAFLPKLVDNSKIEGWLKKRLGNITEKDNILFYKDIFKYSFKEYYEEFQKKVLKVKNIDSFESENNRYEKTLIMQIVVLSGISYKKYLLFDISLKLTMIPFIFLIYLVILQ
ncbi:hypothetical protein JW813_16750 [Clostridium botulinum]|uniref:Pycsar system effector family protein n=1 Tax=Clostridium botulinum TaxID=1491 RepID=UPI0022478678|nr:Pycsar system effector family protein [Clostridium botulinum]UZP03336.1 hypothetical protein JW813_16750 [Clostridium botulinum]UZP06694.1 hypothetical protein JYA71_17020 [Clostridium botulinum]UZP10075.1 hypothetical protein JYA74_16745 [Clostridium botulinum]